jgi:hypothetical protein
LRSAFGLGIRSLPDFYKIDEETRTVKILRFWHSSRNQDRLRLKENPEQYSASAQPLAAQVVH